ncbi:hypothetical protein K439DRAFT_1610903 [Ramaria rubella]|nr:hypothetical protein K439DRAFT_1610903 [Ramaria rubella]
MTPISQIPPNTTQHNTKRHHTNSQHRKTKTRIGLLTINTPIIKIPRNNPVPHAASSPDLRRRHHHHHRHHRTIPHLTSQVRMNNPESDAPGVPDAGRHGVEMSRRVRVVVFVFLPVHFHDPGVGLGDLDSTHVRWIEGYLMRKVCSSNRIRYVVGTYIYVT